MNLLKSFINKTHELGCGEAIQASVNFLFGLVVKKILQSPYYVSGMIDYHFNPNALKQSNIEPFIDNGKIRKEFIGCGISTALYGIRFVFLESQSFWIG